METIEFRISKNFIIGALSFIAGAILSYVVFLLVASATQPAIIPNNQSGQNNQTVLPETQTVDPTITASTTNPDENTFTSKALGVTFSYLKYGYSFDEDNHGIDRSVMLPIPTIQGKTILFGNQAAVTVYQKQPGDSLETSISKQLLVGIPTNKCLPVRVTTGADSLYTPGSGISYVVLHAVVPNGCPAQFDTMNPSAAFVSLASQPGKFLYVVGNSEGLMPILTTSGDPFWVTMKFSN